MRKYPGLPILNRECTQDYKIPGTNMKIFKGTGIIISLLGIHMDSKNFPNPDDYIPERFLDDSKPFNEKAYLPFGEGPRNCIAYRMGLIVAKVCLISLLSKYNFETVDKQKIKFKPKSVGLVPIGGINMRISKKFF